MDIRKLSLEAHTEVVLRNHGIYTHIDLMDAILYGNLIDKIGINKHLLADIILGLLRYSGGYIDAAN